MGEAGSRGGLGERRTGDRIWAVGAYLDTQQSCCKVSALAMAHYTGCCRRRTHRNECDSASPHHKWQNTHSTMTTPHLKLSLLRRKGWEKDGRIGGEKGGKGKERAITNYHAGCSLCGQKRKGCGVTKGKFKLCPILGGPPPSKV